MKNHEDHNVHCSCREVKWAPKVTVIAILSILLNIYQQWKIYRLGNYLLDRIPITNLDTTSDIIPEKGYQGQLTKKYTITNQRQIEEETATKVKITYSDQTEYVLEFKDQNKIRVPYQIFYDVMPSDEIQLFRDILGNKDKNPSGIVLNIIKHHKTAKEAMDIYKILKNESDQEIVLLEESNRDKPFEEKVLCQEEVGEFVKQEEPEEPSSEEEPQKEKK